MHTPSAAAHPPPSGRRGTAARQGQATVPNLAGCRTLHPRPHASQPLRTARRPAGRVAAPTRAEPRLAMPNEGTGWLRREDARVRVRSRQPLFLGCWSPRTWNRSTPRTAERLVSLAALTMRPFAASVNNKESGARFGPDSTEARREPQRQVSPRIPFVPSAFRGQCLSAVLRSLLLRTEDWGFCIGDLSRNPKSKILNSKSPMSTRSQGCVRSAAGREYPRSETGVVIGGLRRLGTSDCRPCSGCGCDPRCVALRRTARRPGGQQPQMPNTPPNPQPPPARSPLLRPRDQPPPRLRLGRPVALRRTARRPGGQQHHRSNTLTNAREPDSR